MDDFRSLLPPDQSYQSRFADGDKPEGMSGEREVPGGRKCQQLHRPPSNARRAGKRGGKQGRRMKINSQSIEDA